MIDSLSLMRVDPDLRLVVVACDPQEVGASLIRWAESGLTVRAVRGRKMRTMTGLMDEFAAALQFPLYFGENQNAFEECIAELELLPAGEGFVVLITEPDQVLVDTDDRLLGWLNRALSSAAVEWAQPVEVGEWWDRAAVPFHVVLAGTFDEITRAADRWTRAGASPISPSEL